MLVQPHRWQSTSMLLFSLQSVDCLLQHISIFGTNYTLILYLWPTLSCANSFIVDICLSF